MANHHAPSQAKCRKHLKSSGPRTWGQWGQAPHRPRPASPAARSQPQRTASQRGAESCLQGHFPGSPAPPPASHLKTNFPRPRFPAPLSANGLEHWHPPRSGLRMAATGVPLTAPLAVGDSGTIRESERSPDETDAAARQTPGRASDTRAGGSPRLRELLQTGGHTAGSPRPAPRAALSSPPSCSSQPSAGFELFP